MTGVTPTQVSYEIAIGPLKFATVRTVTPDSMELTWANGTQIKGGWRGWGHWALGTVSGPGVVSPGLGGYPYRWQFPSGAAP